MKNKLPHLAAFVIIAAATALMATRDRNRAGNAPAAANSSERQGLSPPSPNETSANRAVAQSPQPAGKTEAPTPGDQLITQAATRLERRASVTARIRHQVLLEGEPLYGIGGYWQQGAGEDLRVRLELQIAGQDANLLQVSNGRFLWTERRLPTGRIVTNVDLRKLRADPSLANSDVDELVPGTATWTSGCELIAYTGGLPSLLASLGENFSFMTPQAMRLATQSAAPDVTSIPVYAVVGHWRPERIAALLSKRESPEAVSDNSHSSSGDLNEASSAQDSALRTPHSPLPTRLPQEVLILVGQADLFPYRVEYRRLETPPDGPPIPYQLSANPMVVLELIDVAFDVPIATGQFDYVPGDANITDLTATILHRLRTKQNQLADRSTNPRK